MLQKKFRILSAGVLLSLYSSCGRQGPVVDVCISRPPSNGFVCVDKDQKVYLKAYADSDKYIAFSPDDARKLLQSCNIGSMEQSAVVSYMTLVDKLTAYQTVKNERTNITERGTF